MKLQTQKIKKIFLLAALPAVTFFVSSLVACSNYWAEMRDKQYVSDTVVIYSKSTDSKKNYVQLNIVGFNNWFSFSDWYWSYQRQGPSNITDPKQFFNTSVKKDQWIYENGQVHEWSKMDIINELMPQKEFKDFLIQKGYPNYLKSISLVTDQESLKKQLRLNDEDQKKHNTYLERIEGKTLTTAELAKLKPWSESFNQQTIESKLTLKDHDYLFVKDLWEYFSSTAIRVSRVEAGIELLDYIIDIENKIIKMKAGFVAEKFCSNCAHNARAVYAYPPRTTSFLIPVEKGKITDFNMNEWNIILTEGDL